MSSQVRPRLKYNRKGMTLCHTFSIACDLPKIPYGNYCKSGAYSFYYQYSITFSVTLRNMIIMYLYKSLTATNTFSPKQ